MTGCKTFFHKDTLRLKGARHRNLEGPESKHCGVMFESLLKNYVFGFVLRGDVWKGCGFRMFWGW